MGRQLAGKLRQSRAWLGLKMRVCAVMGMSRRQRNFSEGELWALSLSLFLPGWFPISLLGSFLSLASLVP